MSLNTKFPVLKQILALPYTRQYLKYHNLYVTVLRIFMNDNIQTYQHNLWRNEPLIQD